MAESEVKIRVRLELDQGDKEKIRKEASSFRGGIFGGREDPEIKGFEARQAIGGGVERLRDRTSRAPVDLKSVFKESVKQEKSNADQIKDLESKFSEFQGLISNPQSALQDKIFDQISRSPTGKMALSMIPVISLALTTPAILDKIFQMLIAPGGPFDKRLKIILEQQEEQFLSREAQKRRQLGLDQVVISQGGFGNANGRLTVNTLNQVRSTGVADIGLNEISIGGLS